MANAKLELNMINVRLSVHFYCSCVVLYKLYLK